MTHDRASIREAYRILELAEGAPLEEIRSQFRLLGAVWHPDNFPSDSKRHTAADAKFKAINAAYELLASLDEAARSATADRKKLPEDTVDTEVRYFGHDPRLPSLGFLDWSGLRCVVSMTRRGLSITIHANGQAEQEQFYESSDIDSLFYDSWREWSREGWRIQRQAHGFLDAATGSNEVWLRCRDPVGIAKVILVKLRFKGEYQYKLFLRTAAHLLGFNPDQVVKRQAPVHTPPVEPKPVPPPQKSEEQTTPASGRQGLTVSESRLPETTTGVSKTEQNFLQRMAIPATILLLAVLAVVLAASHLLPNSGIGSSVEKQSNDDKHELFSEATRSRPSPHLNTTPHSTALSESPRYDIAVGLSGSADDLDAMGKFHFANGEHQLALEAFSESIKINDRKSMTFSNRGLVWDQLKKWEEARRDYEKALLLDPNNVFALNNLAWLWASCPADQHRDGKSAVAFATKACNLIGATPPPNFQGTLAAAYAEIGDFESAVDLQIRAITFATDPSQKAGMTNRLESYRRRTPIRE